MWEGEGGIKFTTYVLAPYIYVESRYIAANPLFAVTCKPPSNSALVFRNLEENCGENYLHVWASLLEECGACFRNTSRVRCSLHCSSSTAGTRAKRQTARGRERGHRIRPRNVGGLSAHASLAPAAEYSGRCPGRANFRRIGVSKL